LRVLGNGRTQSGELDVRCWLLDLREVNDQWSGTAQRLGVPLLKAGLSPGSMPCAVVWSPAAAGQSVLLGLSVAYRVEAANRMRGVIYSIACHLTRAYI